MVAAFGVNIKPLRAEPTFANDYRLPIRAQISN
jgi:hypothetical protein